MSLNEHALAERRGRVASRVLSIAKLEKSFTGGRGEAAEKRRPSCLFWFHLSEPSLTKATELVGFLSRLRV